MVLTEEEIKAIGERAERATPGPWSPYETVVEGGDGRAIAWGVTTSEDRRFIAAARGDVPALVASHEKLRAHVAKLEAKAAETHAIFEQMGEPIAVIRKAAETMQRERELLIAVVGAAREVVRSRGAVPEVMLLGAALLRLDAKEGG